jgi:hypothetical protein
VKSFKPSLSLLVLTTVRSLASHCTYELTSSISLITNNLQPRVPSIAVAAGPYVFIYRQLRPYRKWSCPPIDISPVEIDVWKGLKAGTVTVCVVHYFVCCAAVLFCVVSLCVGCFIFSRIHSALVHYTPHTLTLHRW